VEKFIRWVQVGDVAKPRRKPVAREAPAAQRPQPPNPAAAAAQAAAQAATQAATRRAANADAANSINSLARARPAGRMATTLDPFAQSNAARRMLQIQSRAVPALPLPPTVPAAARPAGAAAISNYAVNSNLHGSRTPPKTPLAWYDW
jgi:hypothetical protein